MKQVIYYLLSISFVALTFYIAHYTHLNNTIQSICIYIHLLHFALGFSEGYTFFTLSILFVYYGIIIFIGAKFFELVIRLIRKDY
jgi:hypothetical protein